MLRGRGWSNRWLCSRGQGRGWFSALEPPQLLELPMNRNSLRASSSYLRLRLHPASSLPTICTHCTRRRRHCCQYYCALSLQHCRRAHLDRRQGPSSRLSSRRTNTTTLRSPMRPWAFVDIIPAQSLLHGLHDTTAASIARSIARTAAVRPARYRLFPARSSILTPAS
jgi:hypothetical protein